MGLLRRPEQFAAQLALLITLLLVFTPATVPAQSPATGAIRGTIRTYPGTPIPGVQIVLTRRESASLPPIRSQPDGTFLLTNLSPGTYTLTLSLPGYPPFPVTTVELAIGETADLSLGYRTAKPSQPAVSLEDFPADVAPDENDDGLLSLHGLASIQNTVVRDGVEATQSFSAVPQGAGADPAPSPDDDSDSADLTTGPAHGLARGRHAGAAYSFSPSAIQEFRIAGNGASDLGYSAQRGHGAGALLTTVTRSGSDTLHASAFFTLRSSALAAKNSLSIATSYADGVIASAVLKPHDLRETYGLTLGGPIPHLPAAHYFYAFDQQRRGFPAVSSPADPNFYRLTATQTALLANRGLTPAQINAGLNYVSSLTGQTDRRADQTIHFARLDFRLRSRIALTLDYNRLRYSSSAGLADAPVIARGRASLGDAHGSVDTLLLTADLTLTPRLINQTRVAISRDLQYETPQPNLPQEPAIGAPSPSGQPQAPEVVIGPNGLLFGTPASASRSAFPEERRLQLADTVTFTLGHHLLQLGAEVAFLDDRVATLANAAGTFRYDSGTTNGRAGGLVDFLTDYTFNVATIPNGGCPSITAPTHLFCFRSFSQSFGKQAIAFPTTDLAGFLENTWRLRPGLTLHAGARYDYTLLPLPQQPNAALDGIFAARAASSIFPEDRNNFGPRASLAWEPLGPGRGTFRAGYGIFYGRLPGATIRTALADTALPSSTTRIRITPATVTPCPQTPANGFGYPCAFLAAPPGVVSTTTSAVLFDRHFRLPAVQQASLSVERGFPGRTTLALGGIMNLDRQLPSSTDVNIAPSTQTARYQLQGGTGAPGVRSGETFFLPLYTARITPSFGPVTAIVSNANATYFGLLATVESRPTRSLSILASYTWSKAIDYGQASSPNPRTSGQLDPFSNGYDKGDSNLDYPHLFHANLVWTPQARNIRALRGWEFASLVNARSGRPYSLDLFGGTRLAGGHESLNGSGGALYLPTAGRNTLRLPSVINVDLRIAKAFRIRRLSLRGSAEATNLLNHRNVSSVVQRAYLVGTPTAGITPLVFQDANTIAAEGLNTQPFGTPNATGSTLSRERQFQFTLRATF